MGGVISDTVSYRYLKKIMKSTLLYSTLCQPIFFGGGLCRVEMLYRIKGCDYFSMGYYSGSSYLNLLKTGFHIVNKLKAQYKSTIPDNSLTFKGIEYLGISSNSHQFTIIFK